MPLEKVSTLLKEAENANTSILAFNCIDYNMIWSLIHVAEKLNKPVIAMLYSDHSNFMSPAAFASAVKDLAKSVKVSIGLHLDHSNRIESTLSAIKAGFTSVMFDGSQLPYEENIRLTAKVTETAHIWGVDVEGEIGHVGVSAKLDEKDEDSYTTPDIAADFCERTSVDSVAIAIGSAHGVYKETPKLDIERLAEIKQATDVPLVLHGGSGIPLDQLKIAFKNGIRKFNVGTEFFQCYYDRLWEYDEKFGDQGVIFDQMEFVKEGLVEYLSSKLMISNL